MVKKSRREPSIGEKREMMDMIIAQGWIIIDGEKCSVETDEDIAFVRGLFGFDHYGNYVE